MGDRLFRGALAGLIASLFIFVSNSVSYWILHYAKALWGQMLSQMVYGRTPRTFSDYVLAYIVFFVINAGLGHIYARFMMPSPGAGNYYYRSFATAFASWVLGYTLGSFFRIPLMSHVHPETIVTNLLSVTWWGLVVGFVMKRWDAKYAQATQ